MTETSIPEWLAKEVALYDLDINPPPASILDLGANIGAFALWAHQKWPQACIRCFEPVEENFKTLKKNIEAIPGIQPCQIAVRGFYGPSEIFIGDQHVTHSFHQLGRQTQNVQTVTCIDAAQIPSAEFVKIDTEGCEVEILEHLDLTITRALVVEFHRPQDEQAISKLAFDRAKMVLDSKTGNVLKFIRIAGQQSRDREGAGNIPQAPAEESRAANHPTTAPSPISQLQSPITSLRHIFIAICSHYSSFDVSFTKAMMRLVQEAPKVRITFGFNHDPSVERARNILTANFLETDCTHILFIDSDIIFDHRHVDRVSSHKEPIVGGIYPIKSQDAAVRWCGNGTHQIGEAPSPVRPDGLQEVGCIGTGFLCIARAVFEKMAELHPELAYIQEFAPFRKEHAFFQQHVAVVNGARRFLTEDWNFCFLWRAMGGKVYADTHVMLKHAGRAVWPLDLQTGNPFTGK